MRKFDICPKEEKSIEQFTHGYYQGLIIEIGNMKHYATYVPAQDQNRKFLEKPLKDICTTIHIPDFHTRILQTGQGPWMSFGSMSAKCQIASLKWSIRQTFKTQSLSFVIYKISIAAS